MVEHIERIWSSNIGDWESYWVDCDFLREHSSATQPRMPRCLISSGRAWTRSPWSSANCNSHDQYFEPPSPMRLLERSCHR